MRLICPNCDAQYDIDDDVIPQEGRDVECSNCSHTWFQTRTAEAPAGIIEDEVEPELESDITPEAEPDIEPELESDIEPELESDIAPEPEPEVAAAPVRPRLTTRKPLDSSIADILREESGLGRTEPAPRSRPVDPRMEQAAQTRDRISQLTEEEETPPPAAAAAPTGRGNERTIPGIDEINATLRARSEARDAPAQRQTAQQQTVQRRGFRRGFSMVLVMIGLAIMPYFFVDEIVERLPQSRGFMVQYVQTVDRIRVQLREVTTEVTAQVNALVAEYLPSEAETPAPAAPEPAAPEPVTTEPIATEPVTTEPIPAEPAAPADTAPDAAEEAASPEEGDTPSEG